MLTQVKDVSWSAAETPLEAALLEADEIKRLRPPYNVALAATGRSVFFATADLEDLRERPDEAHPVGPLVSPFPFEALSALRAVLRADAPSPASLARRSRALGVEPAYGPGPECFAAGLARFAQEHGPAAGTLAILRLGARLWAARSAVPAAPPSPDYGGGDEAPPSPRRSVWDAERVTRGLEETVVRAAHAVRRGRWLVRLSESSLAWAEPGEERRRVIVIRAGTVIARAYLEPGAPVPVPPGHARPLAERRAAFDLATFDRLRVLTTELRTLAGAAGSVGLRLGPHARVSRGRLQAVFRWV
jgi:DNA polymerase-3 subunit epsilon